MTVRVYFTKEEKQIAKAYVKKQGMSLKSAIKTFFFEKIEDEYDAAIADKALREYEKNPVTYSLEKLLKE